MYRLARGEGAKQIIGLGSEILKAQIPTLLQRGSQTNNTPWFRTTQGPNTLREQIAGITGERRCTFVHVSKTETSFVMSQVATEWSPPADATVPSDSQANPSTPSLFANV